MGKPQAWKWMAPGLALLALTAVAWLPSSRVHSGWVTVPPANSEAPWQ